MAALQPAPSAIKLDGVTVPSTANNTSNGNVIINATVRPKNTVNIKARAGNGMSCSKFLLKGKARAQAIALVVNISQRVGKEN